MAWDSNHGDGQREQRVAFKATPGPWPRLVPKAPGRQVELLFLVVSSNSTKSSHLDLDSLDYGPTSSKLKVSSRKQKNMNIEEH